MKTRNIIGRKIVRVSQGMTSRGHGYYPSNAVGFIELDNGVRLHPRVEEGDADYFVDFIVTPPTKGKK